MIAFAVWALPKLKGIGRIILWIALLATLFLPFAYSAGKSMDDTKLEYIEYSETVLEEAIATGQPVFVNMTAKWCVTCLVNERVALAIPQTQQIFEDQDIIYIKGDWTNYDENITQFLERYGRAGVPLYVYYKDGQETVLPQILTPSIVENALTGT